MKRKLAVQMAEADLHNLFPSEQDINSKEVIYPLVKYREALSVLGSILK